MFDILLSALARISSKSLVFHQQYVKTQEIPFYTLYPHNPIVYTYWAVSAENSLCIGNRTLVHSVSILDLLENT